MVAKGLRIVLAERDAPTRKMLAGWLGELGHSVTALTNGWQLDSRCRRECPDLVISDLQGRGLDGLAATARLREFCKAPVILISGSWSPEQSERASKIGAQILLKPIFPLDLVVTLASVTRLDSRKRTMPSTLDSAPALVAVADHVIITLDPTGRVTSWNDAATRTLGHCANDVIGRPWGELKVSENGQFLDASCDAPIEIDGWLTRADGAHIWANGSVVRLPGPGGYGAIFRDRTAEKARQATIEARIARLERADKNYCTFLATLAHEMRNQMGPLLNAAQLVKARADDSAMREIGERLERSVRHLSREVEDLLEVGRVAQGKVRLNLRPLELATVIRQAVDLVGAQLDAAGHELSMHIPDGLAPIDGDGDRLMQVLVNLLVNAIKYTPSRGKISVTVEADDRRATVCIADSGIGMSAEQLDGVFDIFTQSDRALPRSQGGLGIGLALVKELVHLHGGEVAAASDGIDQGSQFRISLPIKTGTPLTEVAKRPYAKATTENQ